MIVCHAWQRIVIGSKNHTSLNRALSSSMRLSFNSWFSCDVTAAILVYRTTAKKVFWDFDYIIMQNLSDVLPLFCTPTWPSHHLSENQEQIIGKNQSKCENNLGYYIINDY